VGIAAHRPQPSVEAARLKITEVFLSLQGETSLTGWPTVFIRLTGCPLRCQYCDTAYAFHGGQWRTLERNRDVAAGVRRSVVHRAHPLVAELLAPGHAKGFVGIDRLGRRRGARVALGCLHRAIVGLLLKHYGALVREDVFRHALERGVSGGVIAVVMGVDQQVDRPVAGLRGQSVDEQLGAVRELAVDGDDCPRIRQVADRPTAAGEEPDVTTNRREHRGDRRRLLLGEQHAASGHGGGGS